jgi:hypothetical protein
MTSSSLALAAASGVGCHPTTTSCLAYSRLSTALQEHASANHGGRRTLHLCTYRNSWSGSEGYAGLLLSMSHVVCALPLGQTTTTTTVMLAEGAMPHSERNAAQPFIGLLPYAQSRLAAGIAAKPSAHA